MSEVTRRSVSCHIQCIYHITWLEGLEIAVLILATWTDLIFSHQNKGNQKMIIPPTKRLIAPPVVSLRHNLLAY